MPDCSIFIDLLYPISLEIWGIVLFYLAPGKEFEGDTHPDNPSLDTPSLLVKSALVMNP